MLVSTLRQIHCSLDNYQGPLECLYQLILKKEIDIRDITLCAVAEQFFTILTAPMPQTLEVGAEFVGTMSALMLLKSRSLLPRQAWGDEGDEAEQQAGLEVLHLLIEYCQVKSLAKALSRKEEEQFGHFSRGLVPFEKEPTPPKSGIEHLNLDDLAGLFRKVLQSAAQMKAHVIEDEEWKVSDKLIFLRHSLRETHRIALEDVFPADKGRMELITTFLALLELLKGGEAAVARETSTDRIWVIEIIAESDND
jgi:segregation and condensation protein A